MIGNIELLSHKVFHPISFILLYLFMAITTLHSYLPVSHIETLTLLGVVILTSVHILLVTKETIDFKHSLILLFFLSFFYALSPLISSLVNQDQLQILGIEEYRSLCKMILFGMCMYYFMSQAQYQKIIINAFLAFYCIFACYFLYRYLILNEVREYDLRPVLKIRHGDPNFICAFFSMMVPIAMLFAHNAFKKMQRMSCAIYSLVSLFLAVCAYLTESRMGIISLVIGLIYLFTRGLYKIPKTLFLSVFILLGTFIIFVRGQRVFHRFAEIDDLSNVYRLRTYQNALQVFLNHPIFGVGIYKTKYEFYQNTGYPHFQSSMNQMDTHNIFLAVASDLGLLGLSTFMVFYLFPLSEILKIQNENRYFLICSFMILTLSILAIGIQYKDLFILHIFVLASLAHTHESAAMPAG